MWRDARLSWRGVAEKQSPLHGSSHRFLQTVSRNVHMYSVSSWIVCLVSQLEGISNLQFALFQCVFWVGRGSAYFRTGILLFLQNVQITLGSSLGLLVLSYSWEELVASNIRLSSPRGVEEKEVPLYGPLLLDWLLMGPAAMFAHLHVNIRVVRQYLFVRLGGTGRSLMYFVFHWCFECGVAENTGSNVSLCKKKCKCI